MEGILTIVLTLTSRVVVAAMWCTIWSPVVMLALGGLHSYVPQVPPLGWQPCLLAMFILIIVWPTSLKAESKDLTSIKV